MQEPMHKYSIYHPIGDMNDIAKSFDRTFMFVATVTARDLEEAFYKSQNGHDAAYTELPLRSTSVGDIIRKIDDDTCHMVMGFGFKPMPLKLVKISHPSMEL